ncbi:KAP family P-loop NTPase fold protein [Streptosporangium jomthongense]|uniref:P-loop NTPase fold protein n=1 Tax=Streptosporangium jomthongense TaxID=1193683 RepID=A0ABV8F1Y1_9ACTN
MSEGLTFADPAARAVPAEGGRRALVLLDAPDPSSQEAPARPDARLAGALRAEGFAVEAEYGRGARWDGERVWEFLGSAREDDLLLIRLPSDGGWTSRQLGAMIGAFGRRVGRSLATAVLLVVDFGWSALEETASPVRRLAVAGEPRMAAAALTLTLKVGEAPRGPARSLTDVIAEGLATRAADLDGDGVITVGELHAYALERYAAACAARVPILIAYGAVADVPLTGGPGPARAVPAALARAAAGLGGAVAPASGFEVVRRVYELHLSEAGRRLLRVASLLAEDESVEEVFGDASELGRWGLLGERTTFAHPDVRAFGYSRLTPAERAQTSALLRRRRAGLRAVPPRARLTADRWTTQDQLGHRLYAEAVAAFVRHPETRPPLTIGVKGPWGAGKTSLMRMIQDLLDPGAAGNTPARIHLPGIGPPGARAGRTPTNAEVLAHAGRRRAEDGEGAVRAEPGHLPVRQADWRPTVWFNPWMYQNGEQVWAGLAHEIISQVTERLPRAERERFWLRLNLARIDREAVRRRAYRLALTRLAPPALCLVAGLVLTGALLAASALLPAAGEMIRHLAAAVGTVGSAGVLGAGAVRLARFFGESADNAFAELVRRPDPLARDAGGLFAEAVTGPGYRSRTGFLHLVQTDMRHVLDLVATEERPLVVFVDDLDRCSPGTVAQVIEAINLFLAGEFPNCVFVLAMEPEAVVAHVEAAYRDLTEARPASGAGLGWRFLEKIVQLPLSVPLLDDADRLPAFVRALLGVPDPAEGQDAPFVAPPRSPADPPIADPLPGPAEPPDPVQVSRLEEAIWALRPTATTLDEAARLAQERLGVESRDMVGGLSSAAREAADRVFDDLYSDENAYRAIEFVLPALTFSNPRQIKRYVNVFRFYSFLTYRRALAGAAPASDAEVAKLAALTVNWPHLLSSLVTEAGGPSALEGLEGAAGTGDDRIWERAVRQAGLTGEGLGGPRDSWGAELDALRELLARPHPIAGLARHLL